METIWSEKSKNDNEDIGKEKVKKSFLKQLVEVQEKKEKQYYKYREGDIVVQGKIYEATSTSHTSIKWKENTAIIAGGSVLAGINERTFGNCKKFESALFSGIYHL